MVAIRSGKFDFVLVNFANPDMVGHTGKLDPAIAAIEAVDGGVGAIVDAALAMGGAVIITADHGNCELMKDPTHRWSAHGAHHQPGAAPLRQRRRPKGRLRSGGRICDVAPTMLKLLGLPQPAVMTGVTLLE